MNTFSANYFLPDFSLRALAISLPVLASTSASESSNQLRWMQQIVQLMRAYGLEQSPGGGTLNSVA